MATQVAFSTAFVRLGFSQEAAALLSDKDKENISVETLSFYDEKAVKILCATLRKPGGTIADPSNEGKKIPNPGVYVSTRAELSLTAACFMAAHYKRTLRTLTAADITVQKVERYKLYKEAEDNHKDPDDILKLIKPDKIIDFIDDWPEHLALYDGQNARPLSYVIRKDVLVPPDATDIAFGVTGSKYASLREEIIARADHSAPQYHIDNARVFDLLNEAVSEHKHVKTWIKPYAASRDGRAAWMAFKAHYRGSSEIEAIETAAENRLENLIYRGEKPRYNFETHVSMHRKSHQEIEKATGIDIPEPTKVRRLIKSLQTSTMTVPIATIRAQENLRINFDATVNYLRAFISSIEGDQRNVSQVSTRKRSSSYKSGSNDHRRQSTRHDDKSSKNLDRYYKPQEWFKLDQSVRDKILDIRKKRKISKVSSQKDSDSEKNESSDEDVPGGETSQRKSRKKVSFKGPSRKK